MPTPSRPLLQVPPFPGARVNSLATEAAAPAAHSDAELDRHIQRIGELGLKAFYWDPNAAGISALSDHPKAVARSAFREQVLAFSYADPFTGDPISIAEAIELCGFWKSLIDRNRDISGALGFAFWKRGAVSPLLWGGSDVHFFGNEDEVTPGSTVAIWRSRVSQQVLMGLDGREVSLVEVEDGFIRSAGLGADCVPPLSIVVDRLGAHFDPSKATELENLIQNGVFSEAQLERARALRESVIGSGLSKYEISAAAVARRAGSRTHLLVPGQVEDDRSVLEGGGPVRRNLDLLRRTREAAPDAYILYKPHPDVEAGHRVGSMPDSDALKYADEIVRREPITGLLAMVDEVHVNTSLAGFEALMRGKTVTTHGVPFYAGWGLTRDLGDVPARRSATRTLDELVAAVLLEYPRYLDPVTGLPCPAEIVVDRLISGRTSQSNLIVGLRRVQGKFMRRFRSIVA